MKKCFIDTNIFVEIFVRKGTKSDRSFKLLNSEFNLYTSTLVISEMEWIMRAGYGIEKQDIVRTMRKILTSEIELENKKLLINAFSFYENNNVDWSDCLNMFLMKEKDIKEVYSYDRGLKKFDWIKRIEP